MRIIIPMAGRGTRLRPHTITVPKPLVPVSGKAMVQRLVEDLTASYSGTIEEISFITGDFGKEVENQLLAIAKKMGAKGKIYHQDKQLGVGHAIYCAAQSLQGNCMIAFADTLFKADFSFDLEREGLIWVQKVKDPSAFGVVKLSEEGTITEFVEKPSTFVSDLAIVGIYYFREAERLRDALKHIIDHDIKEKNEYQLTTALEMLKSEGLQFYTGEVEEWLDCGNKDNIIHTNARLLEIDYARVGIPTREEVTIQNSLIIEPCFVGKGVVLKNSVVGPHVSLGEGCKVHNSVVKNSVIQKNTVIQDAVLEGSMLGSHCVYEGRPNDLSLGDYSTFK